MPRKKYRIVTDTYCGYEVQVWRWWFPFWVQAEVCNTHCSIEEARQYILGISNQVVQEFIVTPTQPATPATNRQQ